MLTENQKLMLKKMLEWDREYSYPYFYFDDILDDKTLRKEMRGLIASGRVEMYRGGINEDGEVVGGTGFCITYDRRLEIEEEIK